MKYIIYGIIAVLAVVAAVASLNLSGQNVTTTTITKDGAPQEISIKTVDILVARENIAVGTLIESSMVERQPWPENLLLENFVLSDGKGVGVIGQVTRSAVQKGEPFMKSKLANPNDPGFLAASLPSGMKAVTIATDAVAGVAGFVFPGDRVDVLFTHEPIPADTTNQTGRPAITEVLASGVKVLAINVREGDPNKTAPVAPNSMTLEVTDELAQKLRLAEKNGTLAFSLRSIHDQNQEVVQPTFAGDLSRAASKPFVVIRGPKGSGGTVTVTPISTGGTNSATKNSPEVLRVGADGGVSSTPVMTPSVMPVDSLDKQMNSKQNQNIAK